MTDAVQVAGFNLLAHFLERFGVEPELTVVVFLQNLLAAQVDVSLVVDEHPSAVGIPVHGVDYAVNDRVVITAFFRLCIYQDGDREFASDVF